jgi:serine/threonine-protein kinase
VAENSAVSFTIYAGPADVQVPQVTNMSCADAQKTLNAAKLQAKCTEINSTQPAGTVLSQDPPPLGNAKPGAVVTLTVSNGKSKLPDVRGKTYQDAKTLLNNANWFNVAPPVTATVQAPYKVGQVMSMDPAEGSSIDPKAKITLTVAVAAPLPKCPSATPTSPSGSASGSSTPPSSSAPSSSTPPSPPASPTCTP